jgi:hypothetical protein
MRVIRNRNQKIQEELDKTNKVCDIANSDKQEVLNKVGSSSFNF